MPSCGGACLGARGPDLAGAAQTRHSGGSELNKRQCQTESRNIYLSWERGGFKPEVGPTAWQGAVSKAKQQLKASIDQEQLAAEGGAHGRQELRSALLFKEVFEIRGTQSLLFVFVLGKISQQCQDFIFKYLWGWLGFCGPVVDVPVVTGLVDEAIVEV